MTRRRIYNPGQLTPEELKASFVARRDTLAEMLRLLREQRPGHPCQHMMLIGPRGMGKTTLGLSFLHVVAESPELAAEWQPVPFYEESYGIGDLADFWLAALRHLTRATQDPAWADRADALFRDEQDRERQASYALAALADYCRSSGKRLILFVENIDGILEQVRDEREIHALRAVLIERSDILLLGSANAVFEAIRSHGRPFYEFFRLVVLEGIGPEDVGRLLDTFAHVEGSPDIPQALEFDRGRLETIRRLTAGNPRLLVLACRALIESPLGNAFDDLEQLIDEQTPYFKARIEELPTQARKVFHCLADGWKPMLAKEVAGVVNLSSSHASAQIRQLVDKGYAREVHTPGGKRSRYEVSDRFYNIFYLMRFSPTNRCRLERLLLFLHDLFGASAMRRMYPTILETLSATGPHAEDVPDWLEVTGRYVALDQDFPGREDWRSKAIDLANNLLGPNAHVVRNIQEAFAGNRHTTQIQAGEWLVRGTALTVARQFPDAAQVFRQAADVQPENLLARFLLGVSLMLSDKYGDSIVELERFLDRFSPDDSAGSRVLVGIALGSRCYASFRLERIDDAIEDLARLTEWVDADSPGILRSMAVNLCVLVGATLASLNRLEDGLSIFCRMTDCVNPDDPAEMRSMTVMLFRLVGHHFWKTERHEEARSAWQRIAEYVRVTDSVDLRKVAVNALAIRGYSRFPKEFRRDATLERYRESVDAWFQMAKYVRQEDPEDVRRLVVSLLAVSGDVLSAFGRFGEAETACTKSRELDARHEGSWRVRAEIILRRGDDARLEDAEELARRAIELDPEKPLALHTLLRVLVRRGKTEESLDCLERLLRMDRENVCLAETPGLTHALIRGVAAGQGKRVRRMMEDAGLDESMEPLWHAVRAELGEILEPMPAEVMDAVTEVTNRFARG